MRFALAVIAAATAGLLLIAALALGSISDDPARPRPVSFSVDR
jgi:hypothetical protein